MHGGPRDGSEEFEGERNREAPAHARDTELLEQMGPVSSRQAPCQKDSWEDTDESSLALLLCVASFRRNSSTRHAEEGKSRKRDSKKFVQ